MKGALCLIVVALLLAGCGDGDSAGTGAGTGATAGATEKAGSQKSSDNGSEESSGQTPAGEEPGAEEGGSTRPLVDPAPLPNEGETTAAPGVPTSKGGDNSIQTYGAEGSSDERVEVAELVAEYLDSQAAGDWKTACGTLAGPINSQFTTLAKQMHKPAAGACEAVLPQLVSRASPAALRAATDIHVLSFRVEGERGFLIYEDSKGGVANFALLNEDGEWKVNSLAGYPLSS